MPTRLSPLYVIGFFTLIYCLGLWVYQDYGISIDEPTHRGIGQHSLQYLFLLFERLGSPGFDFVSYSQAHFANFRDRDYGVAFFLPAEFLVQVLGIRDEAQIYYFRHFLIFNLFFGALLAIFALVKVRYQSTGMGLLAVLFLVLSPRIASEAFYNDKDIVFMSLGAIATFTLIRFIRAPGVKTAIWHELASAVAIDIRIMGILFVAAALCVMVVRMLKKEVPVSTTVFSLVFYAALTASLVVLFWPWLWTNPWQHFLEALANMSAFRHAPNMNFLGKTVNASALPWYFIPVWIGVTTPILYLGLFLVGMAGIIYHLVRARARLYSNLDDLQDAIALGLILLPIAAVIVLNSTLYNGWRHVYFVYPSLILVAIHGIYLLGLATQPYRQLHRFLIAGVSIALLFTSVWMVRWHPYQFLYFNALAGNWNQNFEADYWGMAYRAPLEKIASQGTEETYSIFSHTENWNGWQLPYIWNLMLMPRELRERIITDRTEPCSDYLITNEKKYQQHANSPQYSVLDRLIVDNRLVYATLMRPNALYKKYQDPLLQTIDFSNPETRCFLKKGWSAHHESFGVWSEGKQAQLQLLIPKRPIHELVMELRAFIPPGGMPQPLTLTVNGALTKQVVFSFERNTVRIMLNPALIQKSEHLTIDFLIPKAISPKAVGLSADDRELGIGIISIRFE